MNHITDENGVSTMHSSLPRQKGYVIQLNDTPPLYWSLSTKIASAGHWGDKSEAIQFAREKDGAAFMNLYLRHQAEQCKVVPV